ncbi:MAG: GNAT family N-acetyltransferase [Candidatus Magasanikbacteria bacterium]|nr:GNAT family N-acetyltransferase [Candidatus Magasanikbacteria bacterium]
MTLRKYQEAGLQPSFEYKKPGQMKEEGETERYHRIELVVEGVPLGYAELHYMSKPIPSFLVNFVFIKKTIRGFGFGAAIMEQINDYITSHSKMGLLYNVIDPADKAHSLYRDHGWRASKAFPGWMTLNEPKGVAVEKIDHAIMSAMSWMEEMEKPKAA